MTVSDKFDMFGPDYNFEREVVVEKGLVIDSSKLKKNELLKMLGEE